MRHEQQEIISRLTMAVTVLTVFVSIYAVRAEDGKEAPANPALTADASTAKQSAEASAPTPKLGAGSPEAAIIIPVEQAAEKPASSGPASASRINEAAPSLSTEVTTVETEIGLEQIVVRKEKPEVSGFLEDTAAAAEPAVTRKETLGPKSPRKQNKASGGNAKSADAEKNTAAAKVSSKDAALKNFSVGSKEMVQINRTLKKMIESNSQLEEQKKELEQQLTNIRGQRKIEVTRIEKLKAERAQYLAERDTYAKQAQGKEQDFTRLSELESRYNKELADLKIKLADKEKELALALSQPLPFTPGTTMQDAQQVVMNAQDVIDMRAVIKKLGEEIKQKQDEQDEAVGAEKAKAEATLKEFQAKLSESETKLAAMENELTAFQKSAGVDSSLALEEKISTLDNQLAEREKAIALLQTKSSISEEIQKKIKDMETRLVEKEKALSDLKTQGPIASAQLSVEDQKKIQALQDQLSGKEKELADLKAAAQDNVSRVSQETQKKIRDLEQELSQVKETARANTALTITPAATAAESPKFLSSDISAGPTPVPVATAQSSSAAAAVVPQNVPPAVPLQNLVDKDEGREVPLGEQVALAQTAKVSQASAFEASEGPAMLDRRQSLQVIALMDTLNTEKEKLRADEAQVHYNMGNVFFKQGQFKRAAAEYRQTLILRPHDANAHFNLAFVAYEYLQDPKTALEHFRQYLWLNPEAEDKTLVQEKIIDAKMQLGAQLDSELEKDIQKEELETFSR